MPNYTTINGSPSAGQVSSYKEARELQQRIGQVSDELSKMDGQSFDLDPAPDAVTISGVYLDSLQQKATGSARRERGELSSLSVACSDGSRLDFRKLPAGARAYANKELTVVQTRDGSLRISSTDGNPNHAIALMRPPTAGERILGGVRRIASTVAATLAGALPIVGIPLNFAVGSTGWDKQDSRVGLGLLGIAANAVGTMALGAQYVSIAGHTLAPAAGPVTATALAVSAVCAGATSFIASRKG